MNGVTLLLGLAIVAFVRYTLGQESALVLQIANLAGIAVGTVIRVPRVPALGLPGARPAPAAPPPGRPAAAGDAPPTGTRTPPIRAAAARPSRWVSRRAGSRPGRR